MSKYEDGEHICLYFEDYNNEEFFKGWVDIEHCKIEIKKTYGNDCDILSVKRHTYAFWGFGRDEVGDKTRVLNERSEPGRGRFKVTVVESRRSY